MKGLGPGVHKAQRSHTGELDRQVTGIDAQGKPEDIQFQAFPKSRQDADVTTGGELVTGPGWCLGDITIAQVILTDGGIGQVDLKARYLSDGPGHEGIAVRTRPGLVSVGIG